MPEYPPPKPRAHPLHAPSLPPRPAPHPSVSYCDLHVTSNFTFLTGASHPDELVRRAASLGHTAAAITDCNTLAGVVRAHVAAKECGIRLAVGSRIQTRPAEGTPALSILLFPTDRASYGRLCRLLTLGKRRAPKGECHLSLHDVVEHSEGMLGVVLPPRTLDERFIEVLEGLRAHFSKDDRLSLAAWRQFGSDDEDRLRQLGDLAAHVRVPLVATNDVLYDVPERRALQDVLTCIRHGCTLEQAGRLLRPHAERHMKPPEEMLRLFSSQPWAARAVARSAEIALRASAFSLDQLRYEYPDEVIPKNTTAMQHLTELTWKGARERYPAGVPPKVSSQILHELKLIDELQYAHYFLTVHDIVTKARGMIGPDGYPILCQGRGAAANSAVCYCLGVTSVDPDRIDVLFERFVSKERNEPPDIDVDFEHERREEIIQYIYSKYGRDRAALTAEVISYRGRSAVREVGKALGLSLDLVDRLAKSMDWWEHGAVREDRLREHGLNPQDPTLRHVLSLCAQIRGFPRHLSQHVGGFVISRGPLCESVPIENAAMEDRTVIEWDKDDIDALGMLKIDVLGLGMLTCIRKAFVLIEGYESRRTEGARESTGDVSHDLPPPLRGEGGRRFELHTIPPEDPRVYDMICRADTVGVFQIESRAQMSMLPRLKPRCFYDLVIEVAIVRPGPIQGNMVHPYLRRRNNEEPITYPSPEVEKVLKKTLGVPLFQEQAMALAIVAAGFTPGEADQLRRAIAAWKSRPGAILAFGEKLMSGMIARGYSRDFAQRCFDQIKGFSGYGFPESHAASFALLVYISAWLKCYHPAAFAAALINSQPMGFYAPAQIVRDAKEHGVEVREIDVNLSDYDCTLEERHEGTEARRHQGEDCGCRATEEHQDVSRFGREGDGTGGAYLCGLAGHAESRAVRADDADAPGGGIGAVEHRGGICKAEHDGVSPIPPDRAGFARRTHNAGRTLGAYAADSSQRSADGSARRGRPDSPGADPQPREASDAEQHGWGSVGPALRLGMRLVQGLAESEARAIVEAVRRHGPFGSIEALWRASRVKVASLRALARADAFGSMGLTRQQALWHIRDLRDELLPLFDERHGGTKARRHEGENQPVPLPPIPVDRQVVYDYAATGLSLKAHPLSFIRDRLAALGVTPNVQLRDEALQPNGSLITVAGIVLVRQRPSTASGIVFATIEDETGVANLIIRPHIYDRYRKAARHAVVLIARGFVERQGEVVHIMVRSLEDAGDLLQGLDAASRDFH